MNPLNMPPSNGKAKNQGKSPKGRKSDRINKRSNGGNCGNLNLTEQPCSSDLNSNYGTPAPVDKLDSLESKLNAVLEVVENIQISYSTILKHFTPAVLDEVNNVPGNENQSGGNAGATMHETKYTEVDNKLDVMNKKVDELGSAVIKLVDERRTTTSNEPCSVGNINGGADAGADIEGTAAAGPAASVNNQTSEDIENKLNNVITDVGEIKCSIEELTRVISVFQQTNTHATVNPNPNEITPTSSARGLQSRMQTNKVSPAGTATSQLSHAQANVSSAPDSQQQQQQQQQQQPTAVWSKAPGNSATGR